MVLADNSWITEKVLKKSDNSDKVLGFIYAVNWEYKCN